MAGLTSLAATLNRALVKLGVRAETRPWAPHFTLARVKSPGIEELFLRLMLKEATVAPVTFEVTELVLYETLDRLKAEARYGNQPGRSFNVYHPVARLPLQR